MTHMPFPKNESPTPSKSIANDALKLPWKRAAHTDPPLIMFQVEFYNGQVISYAYADLREIRMRDAGYLELCIYGMEKYHILITGRHLKELANWIGMGKIKSLVEIGQRTFDQPESCPSIDKIIVETLTGPTF